MVKFKYGGFRWNRAGYVELESSEAVQAILRQKAEAIARRADGQLPDNGYGAGTEHHTVKQAQGSFAKVYRVKTATKLAKYNQAKHKSLTKSIGGGG